MENVTRIPRQDTRFQPSLEARELAEYFRSMAVGDFVSYADLAVLANHKDVQRTHRYILDTARRIAEKDSQIVMGVISGQGLKRLSDAEIVQSGEADRRFLHRKASRVTSKFGTCVELAKLDEATRTQAITYMGLFSSIALVSHFQTVRTLKKMADHDTIEPLEAKDVLKLFAT